MVSKSWRRERTRIGGYAVMDWGRRVLFGLVKILENGWLKWEQRLWRDSRQAVSRGLIEQMSSLEPSHSKNQCRNLDLGHLKAWIMFTTSWTLESLMEDSCSLRDSELWRTRKKISIGRES